MTARKNPEDRQQAGRPSAFKTEFVEQAAKLCKLGATDIELADFFNVTCRTIYRWQIQFPEFCQALKAGKNEADDRVERSLYHKANGYTFESVKIFQYEGAPVVVPYREHVPPDTTACIFWLKNRKPEEWRDSQKHEHGGKIELGADAAFAELVGALDGVARAKSGGTGS